MIAVSGSSSPVHAPPETSADPGVSGDGRSPRERLASGLRRKLLPGVGLNAVSAAVLLVSGFLPALSVRGCRKIVYPYQHTAKAIADRPDRAEAYLYAVPYVWAVIVMAGGLWIVWRWGLWNK